MLEEFSLDDALLFEKAPKVCRQWYHCIRYVVRMRTQICRRQETPRPKTTPLEVEFIESEEGIRRWVDIFKLLAAEGLDGNENAVDIRFGVQSVEAILKFVAGGLLCGG